jgi:hypothetical protein
LHKNHRSGGLVTFYLDADFRIYSHPNAQKMEPMAKGLHLEICWSNAAHDSTAGLAGLSNFDVIVADEELCRALIRAANHRQ